MNAKLVYILLAMSIIAVLALSACTADECELWGGWGLEECAPFSPLPAPTPEPVVICVPKLESQCDWAGCKYEFVGCE